ncbi:hypothetical protein B0H14DRAFT_3458110 [Mycena olivaceomarginata]|nr:hypothetical protein B0H14DRAFT_3458110 [Mycena olivaceomarginata]
MWPPKGEAASGFLARLITESGSSGLGTGVGDVASVGVTNAEDDVSQTVNMKENRGYQHSHCVCVGGNGPEVRRAGWREREGGRVQLFRFVRSSAPPPPSPSSTSASWSSSPDSISTSPSPSTLIGRVVVLPRGCTPNDLGHDADSDIGFINDALDSVSRNRPRPAHIRTFSPAAERTSNTFGGPNVNDRWSARHRALRRPNNYHRLVDHHHFVSKGGSPLTESPPSATTTTQTALNPIHPRLPPPHNPPIFPAPDDPPTSQPAAKEAEAYAYPSTRARAGENVAADLTPADQICALLAIKEDRVRYLQEGPGTVYFTGQRNDHGELIVKQLEYEECGGMGQTQMWFVVFEVQRRLLAERVIRLGLIGQGYGRVRFEEPCSCGTSQSRIPLDAPGRLPGGDRDDCPRVFGNN